MRRICLQILLMAILLPMVGCIDDKFEPAVPSGALYDYVTLAQATPTTEFTMQRGEDTPLITYTIDATYQVLEKLAIGTRLIIAYKPVSGEAYRSGAIVLYGVSLFANTEQKIQECTPEEIAQGHGARLDVKALWRTGPYVNLRAVVECMRPEEPKTFVMYVDRSTLGEAYPRCYMLYENRAGNDGFNTETVYGSFDISSVWDLPTTEGIKVYADTYEGAKEITFEKSDNN